MQCHVSASGKLSRFLIAWHVPIWACFYANTNSVWPKSYELCFLASKYFPVLCVSKCIYFMHFWVYNVCCSQLKQVYQLFSCLNRRCCQMFQWIEKVLLQVVQVWKTSPHKASHTSPPNYKFFYCRMCTLPFQWPCHPKRVLMTSP